MCNELTNDTAYMAIYAVCLSVIKSCTYWDCSTLQALHEHACLFYEKCNVDREGKMPSNITVYVPLGPGKFQVVDLVHNIVFAPQDNRGLS